MGECQSQYCPVQDTSCTTEAEWCGVEEEMECCQYNEDGSMFGNELYYNTCDHNCEKGSIQVQLAFSSIAIAVA